MASSFILDNTLQGRWREAQYLITTFSIISWRHDWTFIRLDITNTSNTFSIISWRHKLNYQHSDRFGIFLPFLLWWQQYFFVIFHFFTQKRGPKMGPPKSPHHSKNSLYGGYPKKPWTHFVIFYEGQLSRSHLELSFAKITVFLEENGRTYGHWFWEARGRNMRFAQWMRFRHD